MYALSPFIVKIIIALRFTSCSVPVYSTLYAGLLFPTVAFLSSLRILKSFFKSSIVSFAYLATLIGLIFDISSTFTSRFSADLSELLYSNGGLNLTISINLLAPEPLLPTFSSFSQFEGYNTFIPYVALWNVVNLTSLLLLVLIVVI